MPAATTETRVAAVFLPARAARILRDDGARDDIGIIRVDRQCCWMSIGGRSERSIDGVGKLARRAEAFGRFVLRRPHYSGIDGATELRVKLTGHWQCGCIAAHDGLERQQTR